MLKQKTLPQQASGIIGHPAKLRLHGLPCLGHRRGDRGGGLALRRRVRFLTTQEVRGPGLGTCLTGGGFLLLTRFPLIPCALPCLLSSQPRLTGVRLIRLIRLSHLPWLSALTLLTLLVLLAL